MLSSIKTRSIIYILFIVVSSALPFISFQGYSIISNTTSHLGAQGSPHAWIMNITFGLLGVMTLWIFITSKIRFYQIIGSVFSISLIFTGVFRHSAFIEGYASRVLENQLHSVFATLTGTSFVILAFAHGLLSERKQRLGGFLLACIATIISISMMVFPDFMGIMQRLMFLSAFCWIFYLMKPPVKYAAKNHYRTPKIDI